MDSEDARGKPSIHNFNRGEIALHDVTLNVSLFWKSPDATVIGRGGTFAGFDFVEYLLVLVLYWLAQGSFDLEAPFYRSDAHASKGWTHECVV